MLRTYTVQSGDTLSGIAQQQGRVPWSGGIEGVVVNLSDVLELVARW
jgi:hypothetical protein